MFWQTSRRQIPLVRPLVMAIVNVTPDSFSDGGRFVEVGDAVTHAERLVAEGADILDIGGESTRPGGTAVSVDEELSRVIPVIRAIKQNSDIPVSIDTTKSEVARAAIDAGAEIVNDISGLRFDPAVADAAASAGAGLVLMHSLGTFETMHTHSPVSDILADVDADFRRSIESAVSRGVTPDRIALDIGIGFGKTVEQNLELLANLDRLVLTFNHHPVLVGTSRKSFLGKLLDGAPPSERLAGSVATAVLAVERGAKIVRVHDVRATADALRITTAVNDRKLNL